MSDMNLLTAGAFQMEMLNYLRTGNPLIDAVLFSILTYFISNIFEYYWGNYREIYKKFKRLFQTTKDIEFVIESMQPSIGIEKFDGDDKIKKEPNKLYHAA